MVSRRVQTEHGHCLRRWGQKRGEERWGEGGESAGGGDKYEMTLRAREMLANGSGEECAWREMGGRKESLGEETGK